MERPGRIFLCQSLLDKAIVSVWSDFAPYRFRPYGISAVQVAQHVFRPACTIPLSLSPEHLSLKFRYRSQHMKPEFQ
jgi:hypothetical protein